MIGLALIGLYAISLAQAIPSCPDNSVELLPNEEDCTKFYQCAHGHAFEHSCPPALHFNPNAKLCDWPELAGCSQAYSKPQSGVPQYVVPQYSAPQPIPHPEGIEYSDAVSPEEFCAGENTHGSLLPHRECNKFYECSFGHAFVLDCPDGLLYNTESKRCDWAENVDCGDREVPA